MKNFYDSTVIKPTIKIDAKLILTPVEKCYCDVWMNGENLVNAVIADTTVFDERLPLTDGIDLVINIERTHPQAIIVDLTVEGINILHTYLSYAQPSTHYLCENGKWQFRIPSFYHWIHEVTGQGWII